MQQRSLGRTGLKVSRLGLGTMTWGRDTDEHEARDQLVAFVEAGGTLLDTAAGYGDGASEELIGTLLGDVVARDEVVLATKAGISRRTGERGHQRLPRPPAQHARRVAAPARRRPRRPVAGAHWVDDTPLEETLTALDHAVTSGRASYVGVSNYSGWQTAQAATWQRAVPGRAPLASTQVEYSLLNRGRRGRGAPGRAGPRPRRAALVAAGPRRAHRQVPHRHAGGLPRRLAALRDLRRRLPRRAQPPASSRRWRAPPTASAGRRSRWRWPGCATAPASPRRSSAPAPPRQLKGALAIEELSSPPRSWPPSTTCRGD